MTDRKRLNAEIERLTGRVVELQDNPELLRLNELSLAYLQGLRVRYDIAAGKR